LCEKLDKLNLRIIPKMDVIEMEVESIILWDAWKGQVEGKKI
jgi:hypothetical protein